VGLKYDCGHLVDECVRSVVAENFAAVHTMAWVRAPTVVTQTKAAISVSGIPSSSAVRLKIGPAQSMSLAVYRLNVVEAPDARDLLNQHAM